MAPKGEQFSNVMEGGEIQRFLDQFVLPGVEGMPQNSEDVLKDVKEIWGQKGLLTPAELKAELLTTYINRTAETDGLTADQRNDLITFVRDAELSRNAPEHTTGYLGKEHAYTATSLAHLYALEMKESVTMIEADFSNMGGTNTYFREKFGVSQKEAEAMTDKAVLLLCDGVTSDLKDMLPEVAKIIPIRTGGDEVRILVTGVNDPEQMQAITKALHSGIEDHAASMGLQDHPHLKAPTDEKRNGFGIALAAMDMRDIKNPDTVIQELDATIKIEKDKIGLNRLGKIDREFVTAEAETEFDSGAGKPGQSRDQFVKEFVAGKEAEAQADAERLHNRNPNYNKDNPGFDAYVETARSQMHPNPLQATALPAALQGAEHARPEGVELMASPEERRMAAAVNHLQDSGIALSEAHKQLLGIAVSDLSSRDPSAQTFMPREAVQAASLYAAEAQAFREDMAQKFAGSPEALQGALAKAGLDSIDDVKPMAMAVSIHGLAGMNSALGHHKADLGLQHFGHGIIEESLREAGIPTGDPKPYVLAHHGGANFTVVAKPGGVDKEGQPFFISDKMLQQANEGIEKRMEALNATPVVKFLEAQGIEVDEKLKSALKKDGLETFADLQDSKARAITVDGEKFEGKVNGLHVKSVVQEIDTPDGNKFIGDLRTKANAEMDGLRTTHLEGLRARAEKDLSQEISAVFQKMPTTVPETAPPEVQSLAEFKRLGAEKTFGVHYKELVKQGGAQEVKDFLKQTEKPSIALPGGSRFGMGGGMKAESSGPVSRFAGGMGGPEASAPEAASPSAPPPSSSTPSRKSRIGSFGGPG